MRSIISVTDGMPSGSVGMASEAGRRAAMLATALSAGVLPAWQGHSQLSLALIYREYKPANSSGQRSNRPEDN